MDIEKMDKAKLAEACQTALNCFRQLYDALENGEDPDMPLSNPANWPLSLLRAALNPDDTEAVLTAEENWKDGKYIGEYDDFDYENDEEDDYDEYNFGDDDDEDE